jgi:hypothetical protein
MLIVRICIHNTDCGLGLLKLKTNALIVSTTSTGAKNTASEVYIVQLAEMILFMSRQHRVVRMDD